MPLLSRSMIERPAGLEAIYFGDGLKEERSVFGPLLCRSRVKRPAEIREGGEEKYLQFSPDPSSFCPQNLLAIHRLNCVCSPGVSRSIQYLRSVLLSNAFLKMTSPGRPARG